MKNNIYGRKHKETMPVLAIDLKDCKYPNSAKKIAFMMRRYEEDGFTSYWL